MKLIELNQSASQKAGFQKIIGQVSQLLPAGKTDTHAEDAILTRLLRELDNRFTLLCDIPLGSNGDKLPPVIIGPTGIVLLNISPVQGTFRAREDTWWELSKSSQNYNPSKPNLIKQSQELALKMAGVLDSHQRTHPEVIPVLVFSNPGVHLDNSNAAIRIVLMDGVESLISDIVNSEEVLSVNEVNGLADSLEYMVHPDKAIPMGEGEDFFGRDLLEPKEKKPFKLPTFSLPKLSLSNLDERVKLTPRQLLIIEILMIFVILVLIGAIVYILVVY